MRARIDELDVALVKLLSERAACALEIGAIKRDEGMQIYQPSWEQDVLAHVTAVNRGPLGASAMARLFERIIDETRRLERPSDEAGRPEQHEGE